MCVCVCAQAIWKLTDKQTQDLLHARRLLVTRRCVLSTERRIITNQLADNDANTSHPLDSIVTIEHLTAALRRNAAENHELYYRVARGVYCGVCESPDCDRHILSFALGLANVCQKWSMQRGPNKLHLCMHTYLVWFCLLHTQLSMQTYQGHLCRCKPDVHAVHLVSPHCHYHRS